ncbi:uromodulin-like [Bufo bufo]|uniref:uromodulin-like n=1 Tax=Bufo bufo TaxID=8384 RepID=UPI001ABE839A|nr:uromodulin-like [Bufo bufo]
MTAERGQRGDELKTKTKKLKEEVLKDAKICSDCNSTNANCSLKQGYVMCSCKNGFVGNGLNCTPMVFCGTTTCCPPGYTWDNTNKSCVDINECLNSLLHTCLKESQCINMKGLYLCNAVPNPTCPAEVCSTDKDCIRDGTILKCIDPCENYQEIDGSRRLYTLNSVGRFPTDRYLIGWYRYKNGLRLREGYVGPLKCGSVEPYSLSSHPTVSEGVKSVALLTNGLTSNSTGPSILVKACAAGYYVYKFKGLLKSEVYCSVQEVVTSSRLSFNYYFNNDNYYYHHRNYTNNQCYYFNVNCCNYNINNYSHCYHYHTYYYTTNYYNDNTNDNYTNSHYYTYYYFKTNRNHN